MAKTKFTMKTLSSGGWLPEVTEWIPSGSLALDVALGGGWPCGRLSELYGGEASGKSALAAIAIANAQKEGFPCYYLDSEFAVSEHFFQSLGVDPVSLYYDTPKTIQDTFDGRDESSKGADDGIVGIRNFVEYKNENYGSRVPALVIVDSIRSLSTEEVIKTLEKDNTATEGRRYPAHAIYIANAIADNVEDWAQYQVHIMLINQLKQRIDVQWGDKDSTYGGTSIKFHASVRLKLQTLSKIKYKKGVGEQKNVIIGENVRATVRKNKITKPYRFAEYPFFYSRGIDDAASVHEMLKKFKISSGGIKPTISLFDGSQIVDHEISSKDFPQFFIEHYDEIYDELLEAWNVDDVDYDDEDEDD